ncbi:serine/threonine protein phosphatase [Helicobacter didelphidarum]|uniref:Serine/threonine protein phosphatase n=1 Tax=Helicobacter didelphidarum TaxID=2040648 RepID=A0A3D8IKZ5_9HELI|nr:metallophosphoesterase [Helicobacter didelphidarum]RDU65793.1 serine/threonine protein phosphatase [Helicobacter didelphidarum]
MRYLLLTRGMPFCGKTTWIQQYNLQDYTLSSQTFKDLTQSPMLDENGKTIRANNNDKIAFQMLFVALESRMAKGDFIIVEDNHIAKSYFSNYKEMAKNYAYKIFIVDFSSIPFDEIKKRNQNAQEYIYMESELESLYKDLQLSEIPIKCDIIEPSEIKKFLHVEPKNLNGYKVIHHIGDIQGSFSVLKKYLGTMKDDEFYIFLGDYIDRGFQNYEVLKFLLTIVDKKNVCLIEGNHEKWLWHWANNKEVESREFRLNTQLELEQKGFSKNEAKQLYQKLIPYFFYRFHDKRVICTHGGLSNVPKYPLLLSASQSIHGVGGYLNTSAIAQTFSKNAPENYYQFFGHRNKTALPIRIYEKNFIMESQVEFGGFLRTIQLTQNEFKDTSIRNTIFISKEEKDAKHAIQKYIDSAKGNKKITLESHKNLLSIRFMSRINQDIQRSPCCFIPCIIDTKSWQIAGRGYNVNTNRTEEFIENHECLKSFIFPLRVKRKIRGVEAILSYYNGNFFYVLDCVVQNHLPYFICPKELRKQLISIFKSQSFSILLTLQDKKTFILQEILPNSPLDNEIYATLLEEVAKVLQLKIQKTHYMIESYEEFLKFLMCLRQYNHFLAKEFEAQKMVLKKFYYDSKRIDSDISQVNVHEVCNNIIEAKSQQMLHCNTITAQSCDGNYSFEEKMELFNPFVLFDSIGNFTELPLFYDNELRVIKQLIKIWSVQGSITKLQWINNPLRERFYVWFQEYILEFKRDSKGHNNLSHTQAQEIKNLNHSCIKSDIKTILQDKPITQLCEQQSFLHTIQNIPIEWIQNVFLKALVMS